MANSRLQRWGCPGCWHRTEPEMCRRSRESNKHSGCYFLAMVLFPIWCLCATEKESQQKIPAITVYWGFWFWVRSPRELPGFFVQKSVLWVFDLCIWCQAITLVHLLWFLKISFWIIHKRLSGSVQSPSRPAALPESLGWRRKSSRRTKLRRQG